MKKHAIIPVFIPHQGCPNNCVFCNQKAITAHRPDVTLDEVRNTIVTWLSTLTGREGMETIEIAFFGGSFTGIPPEQQSAYLEIAHEYKECGRIHKIHLSTRPDYISHEILDNLKKYKVDVIELGVQSFDDGVLAASGRGHDSKCVYEACSLIKEYGFELGIQLMIGLPQDSMEKCIYSAMEAVKIEPQIARLYPTIVIEDTELMEMYRNGNYTPLTTEEAVERTKEMYRILTDAGINIIRVGLKSSDIINENGSIEGTTFHPAFRQLVEGSIARDKMEALLSENIPENGDPCWDRFISKEVCFYSNSKWFSAMIGHKGCNKKHFETCYPGLEFKFKAIDMDDTLIGMSVAWSPDFMIK